MALELHVWGPAFSLPSIDAQCIAAVAYLTRVVPRERWILIASSDPSPSPTHVLPALRDGDVWIGGFRNIVDYLKQLSSGTWYLDGELDGGEKADCVAFSSFLEAHGQPLVDLSLYVSTRNYTTVTRPLYGTIQSFPLPYLTPSSIRSVAKARTAHLGLSALDIDSEPVPSQSAKDQDVIPPSLRTPRVTISSLLSQSPESAAQIRLDALATAFFEPLQSLRGTKRYFLSQSPSSLDCLALGYLALALLPDLPSPWLSNCMRTKFPQLCAFVHDLQKSYFGGGVTLEDAYLAVSSPVSELASSEKTKTEAERRRRAAGKGTLPWSPSDRGGLLALGGVLASNIADSMPLVSQLRQTSRLKRDLEDMAEDQEDLNAVKEVVSIRRKELLTSVASVVVGVSLFIGSLYYHGALGGLGWESTSSGGEVDVGEEDEKGGLGAYGEAGEALEALARQMDFETGAEKERQQESPVEVEVDLEPVASV